MRFCLWRADDDVGMFTSLRERVRRRAMMDRTTKKNQRVQAHATKELGTKLHPNLGGEKGTGKGKCISVLNAQEVRGDLAWTQALCETTREKPGICFKFQHVQCVGMLHALGRTLRQLQLACIFLLISVFVSTEEGLPVVASLVLLVKPAGLAWSLSARLGHTAVLLEG